MSISTSIEFLISKVRQKKTSREKEEEYQLVVDTRLITP